MQQWLLILSIFLLAGCAIPAGVDPLPYYEVDRSGNKVETKELCILYYRYGFLDGKVDSCSTPDWKLKELNNVELLSVEAKSRRNELQHTILGIATDACTEYKNKLTKSAEGFRVTTRIFALALSAGATVGTDAVAKELAAGATAFTGISQLTEDSYTNDLDNTKMGIELARTRIFRSILDAQNRTLLRYPLSRAVNDAMRYHDVCNRSEGRSASAEAVSAQIQQLSN